MISRMSAVQHYNIGLWADQSLFGFNPIWPDIYKCNCGLVGTKEEIASHVKQRTEAPQPSAVIVHPAPKEVAAPE